MTDQQPNSGRGPEQEHFTPPGGDQPGYGQQSQSGSGQPNYGQQGFEQPNLSQQSQHGYGDAGYPPSPGGPGHPSGPQGPGGPSYPEGPGGPSYPEGPGGPMYPQGPGGPSGGGSGGGKGLLIGLIAAGVVVVGAIIALVVMLTGGGGVQAEDQTDDAEPASDTEAAGESDDEASDDAASEAETSESVATSADTPYSAVESYFTALADGDAEAARSLVYDADDETYLTDEVLAASLDLAPITDLEVTEEEITEETSFSQEVQVSYTLGDSGVTKRINAYENADTETWEVVGGAQLMQPDLGDLETTLNGEPTSGSEVTVFLGLMYEIGIDDEDFTIDGDGLVEATETYTSAATLDVGLTEEATETWRELIVSEVEECVASTDMEAGCGLDMPEDVSGATVVEGSISRSLPAETDQALQRLTPQPSYSTPTLVGAEYFSGRVDVEYEAEEGGVTSLYELYFGDPGTLGTPLVDMTADEPEVIWE